jgi:predicted MarR family transcription regulator
VSAELERLREAVLADPGLQERLRSLADRGAFVTATAALAAELGLDVSKSDVEAGLREARRRWLGRWI